jgi:hypothetical protein
LPKKNTFKNSLKQIIETKEIREKRKVRENKRPSQSKLKNLNKTRNEFNEIFNVVYNKNVSYNQLFTDINGIIEHLLYL